MSWAEVRRKAAVWLRLLPRRRFCARSAANAADMDNMVTKAPPAPAFTPPASCGSLYDFFLTACPLTWNGVTLLRHRGYWWQL